MTIKHMVLSGGGPAGFFLQEHAIWLKQIFGRFKTSRPYTGHPLVLIWVLFSR